VSFEGYLRGLQLNELLQLGAGSRWTGMFRFTGRDERQGRIYLHRGQVVHAECRDAEASADGEDALGQLSIWAGGRFEYLPGAVTGKKTITRGTTAILLEAARRSDEGLMG